MPFGTQSLSTARQSSTKGHRGPVSIIREAESQGTWAEGNGPDTRAPLHKEHCSVEQGRGESACGLLQEMSFDLI